MSNYIKYPRTHHLPWSPGISSDDVRTANTDHFVGREIIVTEKMDGENTTLYRDHTHARSLDSRNHPSRDWIKRWHSTIAHEIPEGWRICGENLYARHSVAYQNLQSYFYGFSLWDEALVSKIHIDEGVVEGYVVRLAEQFAYDEFKQSVAKWVRPNHVQTDQHWMQAEIVPNGLQAGLQAQKKEGTS